jgi:hypothetical protein
VGAIVVEFVPEMIEAALLSGHASRRRPSGLVFEGLMHAFVATILLRFAGLDELGRILNRIHQAEREESRASALMAKGTPLSDRIRLGRPYSWKRRVKTDFALETAVE